MSTDRDTTRIVRSWLDEGVTQLPDRVLDAVLDEVPATHQRRAGWLARRFSIMNSNVLRFGIAALVIVGAVFLGLRFLPGDGGVGGPPAQTPSPTLTPTPTPSAEPSVAEPSLSADGSLPEGPYAFYDGVYGGPPITVTIPAPGWDQAPGSHGTLQKNNNPDPPDGAEMIVFIGDLYVYGDPCQWSTTRPDTPAITVDEVVAALAAQPSRDATEPVDITVDGYAGKSITLHVPDDAVFSACDQGEFASWAGGWRDPITSPSRPHEGPGQIDELWILDVEGELVVMDATFGPETPAEHLDELHAILESMTFDE